MKKFLITIILTAFASTSFAQVKGLRNGIQVNSGISNVCGEGDKSTGAFGFGWIADYNFQKPIYLSWGLGLQKIAHKENTVDKTLYGMFLQLPVHFGFRQMMSQNSNFFVQAGPTFCFGTFGSKIEMKDDKSEIKYFDVARRFDLAVGGRIGVEFYGFQISVGADYGLLQALKDVKGYHNLSANLRIGYIL